MTDKPTENQAVSGPELLPCPFCGAVPQSDVPSHAGRHIVTHHNGCWLGKRMKANGTWQELYADLESKEWNTRANSNSHAVLYEALIKARDTFDDVAATLRMLKHGVAASTCDIAKESLNKTLALAGQGGEKG